MLRTTTAAILFGGITTVSFFSCQKETGIPLEKQWNVVVFFDPECPISQYYTRSLSALKQNDPTGQFGYFAVYPGHGDLSGAEAFHADYRFTFTPVADPDLEITRKLDATVTPQVFLLSAEGEIFYTGAIDNSFVSLGKRRASTSEFYLQRAMEAVSRPAPVPVKIRPPVGCLIER